MDTFNQTKIKTLKPESRNQNAIKNCCGFTLIELLVVISTIATLMALLLPAIQKKREEYAKTMATANLMAINQASNAYRTRMGSNPKSIPDLVQFCSANPGSCSLNSQLASGKLSGYSFDFNRDGDAVAEPEHPGITGTYTLTLGPQGVITSALTPGSDAARQRAFDNILASGAKTVVDLIALDSNATSQVRAYTGATTINAGTLNSVFTTLDTSRDRMVSVQEIKAGLTSDPLGPTYIPLMAFLDTVSRELRWDTLSAQEGQDIMVATADLDITQPSLFSYDELQRLTKIFVNGGAGDDILTVKLQAAEDAEASGNRNRKVKSLNQYGKRVNRLIGTSVTRANANTLIALADVLIGS